MSFLLTVLSSSSEELWTGKIKDEKGNTVRTYNWKHLGTGYHGTGKTVPAMFFLTENTVLLLLQKMQGETGLKNLSAGYKTGQQNYKCYSFC